jgi:hypothetical protein
MMPKTQGIQPHRALKGTTFGIRLTLDFVSGVHSALRVQLRSYSEEKIAAPVYETENTTVGIRHANHVKLSIRKIVGINFALTSGGFSVSIVLSQIQATEFF